MSINAALALQGAGILAKVSSWWRGRKTEKKYERWVGAVVRALSERPSSAVELEPDDHVLAARAVREGLVVWGPGGRCVMLPGMYIPRRSIFG